jgi:hypothetical protein
LNFHELIFFVFDNEELTTLNGGMISDEKGMNLFTVQRRDPIISKNDYLKSLIFQ